MLLKLVISSVLRSLVLILFLQYLEDTEEVKQVKQEFMKVFNNALNGFINSNYLGNLNTQILPYTLKFSITYELLTCKIPLDSTLMQIICLIIIFKFFKIPCYKLQLYHNVFDVKSPRYNCLTRKSHYEY